MPALWIVLALALLLVLILRFHFHPFVAMLLAALALGLISGLSPVATLSTVTRGIGDILRQVTLLIVLGALLGKMLETSGAAEAIANKLLALFGVRNASLAILATGLIIGIPVIFGVGFLLLIPIIWRLQRQTGQSLLWFLLPLGFSLGVTHSLVPPKPGIVAAVRALSGDNGDQAMIHTIIFGTLLSVPLVLAGWLGLGRFWAQRQFIAVPEHLASATARSTSGPLPSFALALAIVVMPLALSLLGFSLDLLGSQRLPEWMRQRLILDADATFLGHDVYVDFHTAVDWLKFLGTPEMALLIPTALAFWLLGIRRGHDNRQLGKIAGDAIQEVAAVILLFGAAGGFKEAIQVSGAGKVIGDFALALPLSPLAAAFLLSALMRIALGSATSAILTASALLSGPTLVGAYEGREVLLILAVANGAAFMTQPADSGFWMIKEYGNMSVRDVFIKYNACRIFMSLLGIAILLLCEAVFRG